MTSETRIPVQPETDETKVVRLVSNREVSKWTFAEWMNVMSGYEDLAWSFSRWLLRDGRYDDSDPDPRSCVVCLYTRLCETDEFIRQMKAWRAARLDFVEDDDDGTFADHADMRPPPPTQEERHLFAVAMGDVHDSAFPLAFER